MISDFLVQVFSKAAVALATGAKDTGMTSNGLRKLDFVVTNPNDPAQKKIFTALVQNPTKLSTPGALAREGHKVIQIRDNDKNALLGNVDISPDNKEIRFNSYEAIPQPVDFGEIEAIVNNNEQPINIDNVKVTASRTATPVDFKDLEQYGDKRAA